MDRENLNSIFASIFYVLIFLITAWGIFWSFYRYGPTDGVISIVFFPYGTYRGIVSFWDEPKWKEEWDERTEHIALLIENSVSDTKEATTEIQISSFINEIKEWVKELPDDKRKELEIASRNYGDALLAYNDELYTSMKNLFETDPLNSFNVQRYYKRFEYITGFKNVWDRYNIERSAAIKMIREKIEESDYDSLDEIYSNIQSFDDEYRSSLKELTQKRIEQLLNSIYQ